MNSSGNLPKYFIQYFLPGLLLIGLAVFAGTHPNVFFGLLGFLCFFTVGVALMIEGWRRRKAP
ncbi:MAG: hypothetical protein A3G87_01060 [Omnitrophica bacterium RIFCSPLOWO2_12_FULL_50_11]|nr:MAG: hypothetical protein A3G87_01060 [Omnitrophica bacterium RIFCSPLOWO2_12_FULL_50_11]